MSVSICDYEGEKFISPRRFFYFLLGNPKKIPGQMRYIRRFSTRIDSTLLGL